MLGERMLEQKTGADWLTGCRREGSGVGERTAMLATFPLEMLMIR